MTKIAFTKNGNGIEQYLKLQNQWSNNSIELIWDINEISKNHEVLLISFANVQKSIKHSGSNITLYDLKSVHKWSVISILLKISLIYKIFIILIGNKPHYIVISNFQFLLSYLIIYKILRIQIILNFSRAEELTAWTVFLIKTFKIKHLIAPGVMSWVIKERFDLESLMRIPKYPVSFFQDYSCSDLPNHKYIVGFIGRLIKSKGLYEFVNAAKQLTEKREDLGFVIIGEGKERVNIQKFINDNQLKNRIHLLGDKNNYEIGSYFRKMYVVVNPSYTEGFSKVWLESILTNTPLILTKHSGIENLIIENSHGLYIEERSINDIIIKVLRLIEDSNLYDTIKKNLISLSQSKFLSEARSFHEQIEQIID